MNPRRVLLVILDGWGVGPDDLANPIHTTPTPTFDYLRQHFPHGLLQASGIAVGLPWGAPGESQVGHRTIGCGVVSYDHYPRVTLAIEHEGLANNKTLQDLISHCQQTGGRLHCLALLSAGITQTAKTHLEAFIKTINQQQDAPQTFLHLFLDGQDSPPQTALELIKPFLTTSTSVSLATICGRDYGLDTRGDLQIKTQRAYNLLTSANGRSATDPLAILRDHLAQSASEASLEPVVLNPEGVIRSGDAILFFFLRGDNIGQLFDAFTNSSFSAFPRINLDNLAIASLVPFQRAVVPVCFPDQPPQTSLVKALTMANYTVLKITDTTRAHLIGPCFNGDTDQVYEGEFQKILPANKTPLTIDPLQQTEQITNTTLSALDESFNLIVVNYSAPDLVGHTGDRQLAEQVISGIDATINKLVTKVLDRPDWLMCLTSDHGNLETIINRQTGQADTGHSTSPVPCFFISRQLFKEEKGLITKTEPVGTLADIAPTLLKYLGLTPPSEMTGQNLLDL